MAQILRLADFVEAKVPDAVEAIMDLSDALHVFSRSIDAYALCMRSQTCPTDQRVMLEAWEMIRASLCKLEPSR